MNTKPSIKTLLADFPLLLNAVQITQDDPLLGITGPDQIIENSILFCPTLEIFKRTANTKIKLIIIDYAILKEINISEYANLNLLSSPSLQEAMAKIGQKYFSINNTNFPAITKAGVHPTAIISNKAKLHPSVSVGAYSIIEDGVEIAEKVYIGSHTVISENTKIGAFTKIANHNFIGNFVCIGKYNQIGQQVCIEHHSQIQDYNILFSKVFIGRGSKIFNHCEIESQANIGGMGFGYGSSKEKKHFKKVHFGNVIIKNHVHIGSLVNIDRGTFEDSVIGEGTKIDSSSHFAHNIKIGKHCLVTADFVAAGSCTIGDYCVFGGRTSVNGHITITDNVHTFALSLISKSIQKPGLYGGFPLQEASKFKRTYASLTKLPNLIKKINKLIK